MNAATVRLPIIHPIIRCLRDTGIAQAVQYKGVHFLVMGCLVKFWRPL